MKEIKIYCETNEIEILKILNLNKDVNYCLKTINDSDIYFINTFSIIKEVRQKFKFKKIIYINVNNNSNKITEALKLGANNFISVPINHANFNLRFSQTVNIEDYNECI